MRPNSQVRPGLIAKVSPPFQTKNLMTDFLETSRSFQVMRECKK